MGLFFLFLSLLFDWEVSFGGCDLGCQATLGEVNNAAALCDSQIIATNAPWVFFRSCFILTCNQLVAGSNDRCLHLSTVYLNLTLAGCDRNIGPHWSTVNEEN